MQDSIKSHTKAVRGDVTSRGLAALQAHTLVRCWHVISGVTPQPWIATVTPTYSTVQAIRQHAIERGTEPNKVDHKNKRVNVEGIQLDQDRGQWQALTNRAMNLRVPLEPENVLTT